MWLALYARSRPRSYNNQHLEATAGFEPAIGVLQTPALPLGHVALGLFIKLGTYRYTAEIVIFL